jgi:hypothetical protein
VEEKDYRKGVRRAWLLVAALIALVAAWTLLTHWTNEPGVVPAFAPGAREFVPGAAPTGIGYQTPIAPPQGSSGP